MDSSRLKTQPTKCAVERQFLVSQLTEQHSKLAALDRQRDQKQAERDTIAATIAKLEATIPINRSVSTFIRR